MADQVGFKVLEELGLLARGTALPPAVAGEGRSHAFSGHRPVWAYEEPRFAHPFGDPRETLYAELPPGTTVPDAVRATRLLVFLGAGDSPQLREALERNDAAVLVFEPEEERLAAFLRRHKPSRLAERRVLLFLGDVRTLSMPLSGLLPGELFQFGFPVFFELEGLRAAHPAWCAEVVENLEILFYRYRVYHLSGQFNCRGLPLRNIRRGLFYDQQLNAYENVAEYLRHGHIGELLGRFPGAWAVLVAAGPALSGQLEYIRAVRDRAVIVAVNNALKPLLRAGVVPHLVVLNDNALAIRDSFAEVPRLGETLLVPQCLSYSAGDLFPRKFFFGNYRPEVFGSRPDLRLHGSVITTAYSLARHLGCGTCVLAGVQLASEDPWRMSYASGSIHEREHSVARPLVHRHPQLYPVRTPFGETLYTTLNFRDVSLWFLDEIRLTGGTCRNLSRKSILYGPGVDYDPAPDIPARPGLAETFAELRRPAPLAVERDKVRAFLEGERQAWGFVEAAAAETLDAADGLPERGLDFLGRMDGCGVSYLVQRFRDFDNALMHRLVFEPARPGDREAGLRLYCTAVRDMARVFGVVLDGQLRRI